MATRPFESLRWKTENGVGTTRTVAAGMEIESGFVLVLGTLESGMEGLIGPFKSVEAAKKWAVDSEQGPHYVAHMLVPWPNAERGYPKQEVLDETAPLPDKQCLRSDRESAPLPCSKPEGHEGPCYFYMP